MLAPAEIRRSFAAVWMLFRGERDGLLLLDRTLDGFWRSFAVILLILPINAITMLGVSRTDNSLASAGELIVEGLPLLVADWVLFPILLAIAAKPLHVSGTYVSYVVARNWASPLAAAVMTVPIVLQGAGWTDASFTTMLTIVGLVIVIRLHYMIVRLALDVEWGMAFGIVVADFMLSVLLFGVLN